jgi:hypothetical protein
MQLLTNCFGFSVSLERIRVNGASFAAVLLEAEWNSRMRTVGHRDVATINFLYEHVKSSDPARVIVSFARVLAMGKVEHRNAYASELASLESRYEECDATSTFVSDFSSAYVNIARMQPSNESAAHCIDGMVSFVSSKGQDLRSTLEKIFQDYRKTFIDATSLLIQHPIVGNHVMQIYNGMDDLSCLKGDNLMKYLNHSLCKPAVAPSICQNLLRGLPQTLEPLRAFLEMTRRNQQTEETPLHFQMGFSDMDLDSQSRFFDEIVSGLSSDDLSVLFSSIDDIPLLLKKRVIQTWFQSCRNRGMDSDQIVSEAFEPWWFLVREYNSVTTRKIDEYEDFCSEERLTRIMSEILLADFEGGLETDLIRAALDKFPLLPMKLLERSPLLKNLKPMLLQYLRQTVCDWQHETGLEIGDYEPRRWAMDSEDSDFNSVDDDDVDFVPEDAAECGDFELCC